MTILFGVNCENISMTLHRTNLGDLAQTAKVVSGHKLIRNSGEGVFYPDSDRWARSYSGQDNPDLSLGLHWATFFTCNPIETK